MTEPCPTLNLNEVEAKEVTEHQYAAGQKVAGATNPYGSAAYDAGTTTASADSGMGLGYGPENTAAEDNPAQAGTHAGDGLRDAGMGAASGGAGLTKIKEGLKEVIGAK